ncbi:MAG TPA: TetR/AcrR family transcriptional regulator [Acidimicrobiales bacterium]
MATRAQPGRPRDPAVDDAIRAAARALLVEVGYQRLTLDAVARRAGVSRPTLYLRWGSKAALVHDAVFAVDPAGALATSDDLLADLEALVRGALALFADEVVAAAVPGLLADYHDHPDRRDALRDRVDRPVRAAFRARVAAGAERGQIPADVDADALFDALVGAVLFRVLVTGDAGDIAGDLVTLLGHVVRA